MFEVTLTHSDGVTIVKGVVTETATISVYQVKYTLSKSGTYGMSVKV